MRRQITLAAVVALAACATNRARVVRRARGGVGWFVSRVGGV